MAHTSNEFNALNFQGKKMFFCMAQAICCCLNSRRHQWKNQMLVQVLDSLFHVPRPWPLENVAGFLLFCSEPVLVAALPISAKTCAWCCLF